MPGAGCRNTPSVRSRAPRSSDASARRTSRRARDIGKHLVDDQRQQRRRQEPEGRAPGAPGGKAEAPAACIAAASESARRRCATTSAATNAAIGTAERITAGQRQGGQLGEHREGLAVGDQPVEQRHRAVDPEHQRHDERREPEHDGQPRQAVSIEPRHGSLSRAPRPSRSPRAGVGPRARRPRHRVPASAWRPPGPAARGARVPDGEPHDHGRPASSTPRSTSTPSPPPRGASRW